MGTATLTLLVTLINVVGLVLVAWIGRRTAGGVRQAVADVHDEVRTSNGSTLGELVEGLSGEGQPDVR